MISGEPRSERSTGSFNIGYGTVLKITSKAIGLSPICSVFIAYSPFCSISMRSRRLRALTVTFAPKEARSDAEYFPIRP